MKPVWYTVREKFGPDTDGWSNYLAWSKLSHLVELVSLDSCLCPSTIKELSPEDWEHNVKENYKTEFFTDLDYLLKRFVDFTFYNTLAVIEEPGKEDIESFADQRFVFMGFDLVEQPAMGISALSNCGGFEKALSPEDLNPSGLITSYDLAREIQTRLIDQYPDEHHAACSLWALWRMETAPFPRYVDSHHHPIERKNSVHLEAVTKEIRPGLAELIADLGDGENGFGGTPVPKGEMTLPEYLQRCVDMTDPSKLRPGHVLQTVFWVIDEADDVVGMVRMRHYLNERLKDRGGHIGYFMRKDQRGKGYGREALRLALIELRKLGEKRAMLTVDMDNPASIKVIEANGGKLESMSPDEDGKVFGRYWIELDE